jgi:hypothetical protein
VKIILFINSMNNINTNNFKTKLLFGNLSNSERDLYDKISELIDSPDVMRILDSSHFFVKEYLQQEFKQSSRFKIDKIHHTGVPLKEPHEKRLRDNRKTSVKFSSSNRPNQELQLSSFTEQKPTLRYFTMGSRQHPKQFERWSPEEMYNWWFKLRNSGISKFEWEIMDAVFFLFINQISRICNSYIKYGIKKDNRDEIFQLQKYFTLLDEFYRTKGKYVLLLSTHFAFCEWFNIRLSYEPEYTLYVENNNKNHNIIHLFNKKRNNKIIQVKKKSIINKNTIKIVKLPIIKLFNKNDYSLILFTSYFQSPTYFVNLYSIPVITSLGVPHKSHNGVFYSPFSQIKHDILIHSRYLIKYFEYIYSGSQITDIEIFKQKKIFLKLLKDKNNDELELLLWHLIHESSIFKTLKINGYSNRNRINKNNNKITNILKQYYIQNNKTENEIPSLLKKNLDLKNTFFSNHFFEIDILLEQLQRFKFFVENIIYSEKGKLVLPKILACIDILIETCQETLERDKPIFIIKEPTFPYKKLNNNQYSNNNSNNNNNNNKTTP